MYPNQVPIDPAHVERLTRIFKTAYADIVKQMTTATDWGVQNRKQILAQVEKILSDIGVDVQKFIEDDLSEYYKQGANDAVAQLTNIGADVSVAEGYNRVHMEAIKALVDDTAKAFGESMTGVLRSADLMLGRATREAITQKIATGVIGGEALRQVKKQIIGTIAEQGLDALKDKAGHAWSLDRYAEMLYRTKVVEARNRGLINRMVENEYDLVMVSAHAGSCDKCAPWQGQILSATGQTKGYHTVAQAEQDGLFHPNCRHAINIMIPSLARLTQAYEPSNKAIKAVKVTTAPAVKLLLYAGGKNSHTITNVRQWESDLMKARGLEIAGKGAPRNYGVYKEQWIITKTSPRIEINTTAIAKTYKGNRSLYEKQVERTFYHETGHFIDFRLTDDTIRLTQSAEVLAKLKSEANEIVVNRLAHSYLGELPGGNTWVEKWGLTFDDMQKLANGRSIPIKNKVTGYETQIKLTRKQYQYYWSSKEVFADAYAQYRTNPVAFNSYAPKMFEYFEKLGGVKL